MENNWYVYRHIRLDKNVPFYIGIGNKKCFYRAFEINDKKRNLIWNKIYKKTKIKIEILFENISKEDAFLKEKEFIKLYGRIDLNTGTLCNLTDGGDGIWNCKRSDETKLKLRMKKIGKLNPQYGKKQTEDTIRKKIISLTGQKRSDVTKNKQSIASIYSGQAKTTEVYDYKTNEFLGSFHSLSEACRKLNLDPLKSSGKASQVALGKRKQHKNFIFKYV